jgi:YD repeat-containing protein
MIIKQLVSALALTAPALAHGETVTTYSYDALGRLVQADTTGTVNNGVQMKTDYDAADNRTSYKVTGARSKAVVVPLDGLRVTPVLDN